MVMQWQKARRSRRIQSLERCTACLKSAFCAGRYLMGLEFCLTLLTNPNFSPSSSLSLSGNNSQRIPVPTTTHKRLTPMVSRRGSVPRPFLLVEWTLNSWETRSFARSTMVPSDPRRRIKWNQLTEDVYSINRLNKLLCTTLSWLFNVFLLCNLCLFWRFV